MRQTIQTKRFAFTFHASNHGFPYDCYWFLTTLCLSSLESESLCRLTIHIMCGLCGCSMPVLSTGLICHLSMSELAHSRNPFGTHQKLETLKQVCKAFVPNSSISWSHTIQTCIQDGDLERMKDEVSLSSILI